MARLLVEYNTYFAIEQKLNPGNSMVILCGTESPLFAVGDGECLCGQFTLNYVYRKDGTACWIIWVLDRGKCR